MRREILEKPLVFCIETIGEEHVLFDLKYALKSFRNRVLLSEYK